MTVGWLASLPNPSIYLSGVRIPRDTVPLLVAIVLPVWHNVTKREVMEYSPSLADRVARSTATHTVEEIAAEIVDVIRNPPEG